MRTSISVTQAIAAPPDTVWTLVSDLPRMGEWSPENTGGTWTGGADGPAVDARFKGTNALGKKSWNTAVKVTRCEPGRAFEFDVTAFGLAVATWGYVIEPSDTGCVVTETWTDNRGRVVKTVGGAKTGVHDRETANRANMERTLANLAAAAEGAHA
jgi:hypothetical protein